MSTAHIPGLLDNWSTFEAWCYWSIYIHFWKLGTIEV